MPKLPHREPAPVVDLDDAMSPETEETAAESTAPAKEKAPSFRSQVISKIREEDPSIPVKALEQAFSAGAYEAQKANADQFFVARVMSRQALEDDGAERCMITLQFGSIRSAEDPNPVLSKPVYVFVPVGQWKRYPVGRQFSVQLHPIADQAPVNVSIPTEPGTESN